MKNVGIIIVVALMCILVSLTPAQAQPAPFPMQLYGVVTIGGEPAPLGTLVSTRVKGIESGSVTTWELGKYGWGRPGAPNYAYQANLLVQGYHITNGDLIEFYINNVKADQTAVFQSDVKTRLDLTVASAPPTHIWDLCAKGFFPNHLPDSYYGQVMLADLLLCTIPDEVQGVYWYDCNAVEWKFWAPGAPGCTLTTLGGGHTYDYMVSVTGSCDWYIPLSEFLPDPTGAKEGDTVKVLYTGTLNDGTVFDSSELHAGDPIEFTIDEGNLLQCFEQTVIGMQPGQTKTVHMPADKAYGPYDEELVITVAWSQFEEGFVPEVGEKLYMRDTSGQIVEVTVLTVTEAGVVVDANHPLAGEDLNFEITLVEIL